MISYICTIFIFKTLAMTKQKIHAFTKSYTKICNQLQICLAWLDRFAGSALLTRHLSKFMLVDWELQGVAKFGKPLSEN